MLDRLALSRGRMPADDTVPDGVEETTALLPMREVEIKVRRA